MYGMKSGWRMRALSLHSILLLPKGSLKYLCWNSWALASIGKRLLNYDSLVSCPIFCHPPGILETTQSFYVPSQWQELFINLFSYTHTLSWLVFHSFQSSFLPPRLLLTLCNPTQSIYFWVYLVDWFLIENFGINHCFQKNRKSQLSVIFVSMSLSSYILGFRRIQIPTLFWQGCLCSNHI